METSITHKRVLHNPHMGFLLRQNCAMKKNQQVEAQVGEILASNLSKVMDARGLTDASLGKSSGVGRSTVQRMRKNETSPALENVIAIAAALQLRLEDLLADGTSGTQNLPSVAFDPIVQIISTYARVSASAREEILEYIKSIEERELGDLESTRSHDPESGPR